MTPIDFPFAHEDVVKKVVDDVKRLSDESLAVDRGIHDIKRAAEALAEKYKDNITAHAGLSAGVEEYAKRFNVLLGAARKSASLGVGRNNAFVNEVVIPIVEGIKTQEELNDAILELKDIAKKEPLPVEGFPGATQKFGDIWATSSSDAAKMLKVLEGTTDIEKTVQELTKAFAPAKAGYKEVTEALNVYAVKM